MDGTITIPAYEYAYLVASLERAEMLRRYMSKKQILLKEDFDIIFGVDKKREIGEGEEGEATRN